MFPSIRLKLILAFLIAVFLTVALTGIGSFVLLRDAQVKAERERIGLLVLPTATEVQELVARSASLQAISAYLHQRAQDWNVRFLLLDQAAKVVIDTQDQLTGQTFTPSSERRMTFSQSGPTGFRFTSYEAGPQRQVIFAPPIGPQNVTVQVPRQYDLMMSVPEGTITGAWKNLLPKLGIPALVAMVVASLIAFVLARSIARPVWRVTRASEAMALGMYNQEIEVEGRDEIGRLAASFNIMASQVARSHGMMRDLLANVAHELKTPLTSIRGFSQALVDGDARTPEDQAQAARIINDEADRMRTLVEDLLYLSQLESGQLRMEKRTIDTATLLRTTAERISWQVRDSGREFRLLISPDLPSVYADERRLEQVLANLLDNATRHTPEGGSITLTGSHDAAGVSLTVHNTGSFIAPELLPRVFERFYRADPSRVHDGRHGGLGLSIAQEIVAAHGGRIEAESTPEAGTTFRVLLPLPAAPAPPEPVRSGIASRLPLVARRQS